MKKDLETTMATTGALTGLGLARFIKNAGSVITSTGKFVKDSAVETAKVVKASAVQNVRELKLKLR